MKSFSFISRRGIVFLGGPNKVSRLVEPSLSFYFNKNILRAAMLSTTGTDDSELGGVADNTTWNLKSLRDEVNRQMLRSIKKISKINERKSKAVANLSIIDDTNSGLSLDEELLQLQLRLEALRNLDDSLRSVKTTSSSGFEALLPTIDSLQITPTQPVQVRGPKKIKQKPPPPRQPFFTYIGEAGIEIRVGRGASDNDELSCNPKYRDSDNWWLHVAGHAGSHVVIRTNDDNILANSRQTVLDAALLAAVNSKANQSGKVAVSLTRCRNVTKPRGAKPGLVHLQGDVTTIYVDCRTDIRRLDQLKKMDTELKNGHTAHVANFDFEDLSSLISLTQNNYRIDATVLAPNTQKYQELDNERSSVTIFHYDNTGLNSSHNIVSIPLTLQTAANHFEKILPSTWSRGTRFVFNIVAATDLPEEDVFQFGVHELRQIIREFAKQLKRLQGDVECDMNIIVNQRVGIDQYLQTLFLQDIGNIQYLTTRKAVEYAQSSSSSPFYYSNLDLCNDCSVYTMILYWAPPHAQIVDTSTDDISKSSSFTGTLQYLRLPDLDGSIVFIDSSSPISKRALLDVFVSNLRSFMVIPH
eukprot:gene29172-38641_t